MIISVLLLIVVRGVVRNVVNLNKKIINIIKWKLFWDREKIQLKHFRELPFVKLN